MHAPIPLSPCTTQGPDSASIYDRNDEEENSYQTGCDIISQQTWRLLRRTQSNCAHYTPTHGIEHLRKCSQSTPVLTHALQQVEDSKPSITRPRVAVTSPLATTSNLGYDSKPRKRSLSVGAEQMCRDFAARQIEQCGLSALLESPAGVCYLLSMAIGNYSPETLLFYLEAEHYRRANFGANERRTRYAKGLYKAFISHRAPLEINISHAVRQRITHVLRAASQAPPPADLFQEAQGHAYSLLEQDYIQFRQQPLFVRMKTDLGTPFNEQAKHAVSVVYDHLSRSYGVQSLPPDKPRLVESEAPHFIKFADMDLTSIDIRIALPAWLCRTTIRLLNTPLPSTRQEMNQLLRNSESASSSPTTHNQPSSSASSPTKHKPLPTKQRSMQRLRVRLQHDLSLLTSRRRKEH